MTPSTAEHDRARTLYFLTDRKQWPHWPFLPVVRRRPGCEDELGVLFDALNAGGPAGYACTVFFSNLFLLPPRLDQLLNLPRETFDTAEEVADAGWSVD
jgi:hypothetical protein